MNSTRKIPGNSTPPQRRLQAKYPTGKDLDSPDQAFWRDAGPLQGKRRQKRLPALLNAGLDGLVQAQAVSNFLKSVTSFGWTLVRWSTYILPVLTALFTFSAVGWPIKPCQAQWRSATTALMYVIPGDWVFFFALFSIARFALCWVAMLIDRANLSLEQPSRLLQSVKQRASFARHRALKTPCPKAKAQKRKK